MEMNRPFSLRVFTKLMSLSYSISLVLSVISISTSSATRPLSSMILKILFSNLGTKRFFLEKLLDILGGLSPISFQLLMALQVSLKIVRSRSGISPSLSRIGTN